MVNDHLFIIAQAAEHAKGSMHPVQQKFLNKALTKLYNELKKGGVSKPVNKCKSSRVDITLLQKINSLQENDDFSKKFPNGFTIRNVCEWFGSSKRYTTQLMQECLVKDKVLSITSSKDVRPIVFKFNKQIVEKAVVSAIIKNVPRETQKSEKQSDTIEKQILLLRNDYKFMKSYGPRFQVADIKAYWSKPTIPETSIYRALDSLAGKGFIKIIITVGWLNHYEFVNGC